MSARGRLPPLSFPHPLCPVMGGAAAAAGNCIDSRTQGTNRSSVSALKKGRALQTLLQGAEGRGVYVCGGGRGTLSSMILSELNPFTCFSGTRAHSTKHSKLFALLLPSWTLAIETASALPTSAYICLCLTLERERESFLCVCVHDPQPLITFCSIASDAIAAAAFGDWRMRLKNFVQL